MTLNYILVHQRWHCRGPFGGHGFDGSLSTAPGQITHTMQVPA